MSGESGEKKRPVIIHRAILGSVERMTAILTKSYAGKWPFWLSPRQVMVIPVGPSYDEYAEKVKQKLYDAGFMAEVDTDAVVGEKKRSANTVNVRTRDNIVQGEVSVEMILEKLRHFQDNFVSSEDKF